MNVSERVSTDGRFVRGSAAKSLVPTPARRLAQYFIWTAAIILLLTAFGKICSAFGTSRVLEMEDPILGMRFRVLLPLVGVLELVIGTACLCERLGAKLQLLLIAWIGIVFFIYRVGLWVVGWHHPCNCMGSLAGYLRLSDASADSVVRYLLGYLLVGSVFCLLQANSRMWRFKTGSLSRTE